MIDTQRKAVNSNTVKNALSIKKKLEVSRKSNIKKLFSVKRDSKIYTQAFIIVVTRSAIINASIVKSFSNEFNHIQYSRSLNKIKHSLKNLFKNITAKTSINEFLI